ncbi:hypothetical protein ABKN59_005997 [Abortiporus biennis]
MGRLLHRLGGQNSHHTSIPDSSLHCAGSTTPTIPSQDIQVNEVPITQLSAIIPGTPNRESSLDTQSSDTFRQTIDNARETIRQATQILDEAYQRLAIIRSRLRQHAQASMPVDLLDDDVQGPVTTMAQPIMGPSHSAIVLTNVDDGTRRETSVSPQVNVPSTETTNGGSMDEHSLFSADAETRLELERLENTIAQDMSFRIPEEALRQQIDMLSHSWNGEFDTFPSQTSVDEASTTLGRRVALRAQQNNDTMAGNNRFALGHDHSRSIFAHRTVVIAPPSPRPSLRQTRIAIRPPTHPRQPQSPSSSSDSTVRILSDIISPPAPQEPDVDRGSDSLATGRRYRVVRHYNADGDERVHTISMDNNGVDENNNTSHIPPPPSLQSRLRTHPPPPRPVPRRSAVLSVEPPAAASSMNRRGPLDRFMPRGTPAEFRAWMDIRGSRNWTSGGRPEPLTAGGNRAGMSEIDALEGAMNDGNGSSTADDLDENNSNNLTAIGRRRRRGWARLDEDGNEISPAAENRAERAREWMRARAQLWTSRYNTSTNGENESSSFNHSSSPPTYPIPPPAAVFNPTTVEVPAIPMTGQAQVRLNSRLQYLSLLNPDNGYGFDGVGPGCKTDSSYENVERFEPSVLPLPLVKVGSGSEGGFGRPAKRRAIERSGVRVSRSANFAGR